MTDKENKGCSDKKSCAIAKSLVGGAIGGIIAVSALLFFAPNFINRSSSVDLIETSSEASSIAVIDRRQIFTASKAGESLKAQIDAAREEIQAKIKSQEADLKKQEAEISKLKKAGNEKEFIAKRKAFEENLMKARKDAMLTKNNLDDAITKATKTLNDEIVSIASTLGQENGYNIVITRANVVIVSEDIDITSDVLKEINKSLTSVELDFKK